MKVCNFCSIVPAFWGGGPFFCRVFLLFSWLMSHVLAFLGILFIWVMRCAYPMRFNWVANKATLSVVWNYKCICLLLGNWGWVRLFWGWYTEKPGGSIISLQTEGYFPDGRKWKWWCTFWLGNCSNDDMFCMLLGLEIVEMTICVLWLAWYG